MIIITTINVVLFLLVDKDINIRISDICCLLTFTRGKHEFCGINVNSIEWEDLRLDLKVLMYFPNSALKHPGIKWRDFSGVRTVRLIIGRSFVMESSRSADQTWAERTNVFLLRCAELLNRQQEERLANISLPDQLWMNQSLGGQHNCTCVNMCVYSRTSWLTSAGQSPTT